MMLIEVNTSTKAQQAPVSIPLYGSIPTVNEFFFGPFPSFPPNMEIHPEVHNPLTLTLTHRGGNITDDSWWNKRIILYSELSRYKMEYCLWVLQWSKAVFLRKQNKKSGSKIILQRTQIVSLRLNILETNQIGQTHGYIPKNAWRTHKGCSTAGKTSGCHHGSIL